MPETRPCPNCGEKESRREWCGVCDGSGTLTLDAAITLLMERAHECPECASYYKYTGCWACSGHRRMTDREAISYLMDRAKRKETNGSND